MLDTLNPVAPLRQPLSLPRQSAADVQLVGMHYCRA